MKKILTSRYVQAMGVVILTLLFAGFGQGIGLFVTAPLRASNDAGLSFAGEYLSFIGMWVFVILYCYIVKKNRKFLPKLSPRYPGNKIGTVLLIGLSTGIGLNLLVAVVAMLHGDISLTFSSFNVPMVLLFIVSVMVQSGAEELLCRFFLYNKIKELFPKHAITPVIVTAIFFSLLHGANDGITILSLVNITVVGVLYALIIYYFDSFWAAAISHTSWNFCQSILLGLPNSGRVSGYSIFTLNEGSKDSFTYNTGFGIEGTVLACVVLLLACIVMVLIGRKKKAKEAAKVADKAETVNK